MSMSLFQLERCLGAAKHCIGTTRLLMSSSRNGHNCHAEQLQQAGMTQHMSRTLQQSHSLCNTFHSQSGKKLDCFLGS